MKQRLPVFIMSVCLVLVFTLPVGAQRLCEAIVEKALEQAGENCGELSGDVACYGYDTLSPTFYEDTDEIVLRTAGSSVDLAPLHILEGTGFDAEEDEWSIGYVQIGEGAPELEDGEAIRLIMLGDITVENAVEPDDNALVPFESIFMSEGDDSDCQEAVNDLVIQTPPSTGIIMTINDVTVGMGSTVVYGWANNEMYVTVLDGEAFMNYGEADEQVIGQLEVATTASRTVEEPMVDAQTGAPVLDENGNPVMRRYVERDFSEPTELSDDNEGYRTLSYYETFEGIPESLLNYPIDLEGVCECELDDDVVAECSIPTAEWDATIVIENTSESAVDVAYIASDCTWIVEGTLFPGDGAEAGSFPGEEWLFLQDGQVVGGFVVTGNLTYSYP